MEAGLVDIWKKFNEIVVDLAIDGSSPEVDLENGIRKNNPRAVARAIDKGATQMSLDELIRQNLKNTENPKDPKRLEILEVLISKKDDLDDFKKSFESGKALETTMLMGNLAHFKILEQAMLDEGITKSNLRRGLERAVQEGRKDLVKAGVESPFFDKVLSSGLLQESLVRGDKESSRLFIKNGGDPTYHKTHQALSFLKKEFEENPTKENQSKLDLTLNMYSQKDKKALLDDPKWTGIIHTLCKSMLEDSIQKPKKPKDQEMSMG
jgi:hypothetical protein